MSLRRFLIGWTALAFVVWLLAVSAFESDEDCSSESSAYVCIGTRKAALAGSLFVGVPWLLGLVFGMAVAGVVRWRRTRTG